MARFYFLRLTARLHVCMYVRLPAASDRSRFRTRWYSGLAESTSRPSLADQSPVIWNIGRYGSINVMILWMLNLARPVLSGSGTNHGLVYAPAQVPRYLVSYKFLWLVRSVNYAEPAKYPT
jgi:hypothetical protein